MSTTSAASHPVNGKDASSRTLPGLHELLSPSLRHDTSSSGRFPSLNNVGRSNTASFPSPTTFAPPPQSWQPGPPQALPGRPSFSTEHVPSRPSNTFFGINSNHTVPPNLHPPQVYPPPGPRLSIPSDYRGAIAAFHGESIDEQRRDSARSNSTYSTSNIECVGQQHFPGRGLCYVFSNGDSCPTVIDGEVVNPLWGTTKAGKARKRLAQACLNCREKKIRCEPRHPRCLQCEKSKRDCIMPSNQQHPDNPMASTNTPGLPALSPAPNRHSPSETNFSDANRNHYGPKRRRSDEPGESTSPRDTLRNFSVRPKLSNPSMDNSYAAHLNNDLHKEIPRTRAESDTSSDAFPASGVSNNSGWDVDPFEQSPDETIRLVTAFFAQSINSCNILFPKQTFWKWLTTNTRKSSDERMVLLSMLALGGAISKDKSVFAQHCAEKASLATATRLGKFGLALAQARLLMCVYHYAKGHDGLASEFGAGAIHTLKVVGMNTETGCTATDSETAIFGMSREQLTECKRRTFWSALLLDRQTGVYAHLSISIPNDMVHLRLPCSDRDFESGANSRAPFFESSITPPFGGSSPGLETSSPSAHIFNVCRISGYVDQFITPNSFRTSSSYARDYEIFYRNTEEQLGRWFANLPSDLHISDFSLSKANQNEVTGIVTAMSSLYHTAVMRSCRYARHQLLDRHTISRNIQQANHSAHQLLQLAHTLCTFGQNLAEGQSLQDLISPFFATAVYIAIDTISAGGSFRDLRGLLTAVMDGFTMIKTIGYVWPFAKGQLSHVEQRLSELQDLFQDNEKQIQNIVLIGDQGWRCKGSFVKVYGAEYDLIYGVDAKEYLYALRG
ncbi:Fungal specific transcription factor domain-containing protein 75 [Elsinoe fawcettii]|nr:Fungal specific transcription factor domain-containing protein 75 [Elsinoe fawcettii]